MPAHKRGRLSPTEKKFIRESAAAGLTPYDIATRLNRKTETVAAFIAPPDPIVPILKTPPPEPPEDTTKALRSTAVWSRLKDEFDNKELAYFEERYVAMLSQFRDDVLATEDNQIMKAIKYEILMSRNLIERKKLRSSIDGLERIQKNFLAGFTRHEEMSETDKTDAMNMANQLSNMRAAEQSKYNEYTTLDKNQQQLMKDLKATRDQRLNRASDGKKNFLDFVKLLQENDVQDREGRQAMRMKEAASKEMKRLGQPHKYLDGNEDQPVLSCDTVGE